MSRRHEEAIEAIWQHLNTIKPRGIPGGSVWPHSVHYHHYGWLEEILTLMESRIQDDLEEMFSGKRKTTYDTPLGTPIKKPNAREKVCPVIKAIEDDSESDIYSPI